MVTTFRDRPWFVTFMVCLIVAAVYAPGFNGFWHGDDLPNLHRAYSQSQQDTLWIETLRLFVAPVPSQGAFYRPMMMLSLAANYALFDAHYAGWYLINFAVHLANTLLVALIVRRLAGGCQCDARMAAPLAALFFGLSPVLAEGVYWVSARSDGWVTLLTLTGAYLWAGTPLKDAGKAAFALPLMVLLALGFKESAAVVPLQMVLLAMAWPRRLTRAQCGAIGATFLAAALFLAWRVYLFGNAWHVYSPAAGDTPAMHLRIWQALLSLPPWWQGMTVATPSLSAAYLVLSIIGAVAYAITGASEYAIAARRQQAIMVLALICASGGLVLATLLNLGSMSSSGEGGRLSYGPIAWLALGLGVFMSTPFGTARHPRWRIGGGATMAAAVAVGSLVLLGQMQRVWAAQANLRAITASIPGWVETHRGLTMLLVPENDGAVVLTRNAQGGIVLAPIQSQPYLHRVVPTLTSEVELRQDQFCSGLATRLDIVRPRLADDATMKSVLLPAETVWPAHVGCWSTREQRIIAIKPPPMDSACSSWLDSIRAEIASCGN